MPKPEKPTLRIAKLPDLTPVKLTVSLEPAVHKMLEDYARIYSDSYGEAIKPSELVPSNDCGFSGYRQWLQARSESSRVPTKHLIPQLCFEHLLRVTNKPLELT